jgi:hypothetical protein
MGLAGRRRPLSYRPYKGHTLAATSIAVTGSKTSSLRCWAGFLPCNRDIGLHRWWPVSTAPIHRSLYHCLSPLTYVAHLPYTSHNTIAHSLTSQTPVTLAPAPRLEGGARNLPPPPPPPIYGGFPGAAAPVAVPLRARTRASAVPGFMRCQTIQRKAHNTHTHTNISVDMDMGTSVSAALSLSVPPTIPLSLYTYTRTRTHTRTQYIYI